MIEPQDLVLIAVVTNRKDLDMARLLGWYRVPIRYAPKVIRVDTLAFYQTSNFGKEKWSIRYAASVRGVELVRRRDLLQDETQHPRAEEEYYKIQLGPVFHLPRTITAKRWKRITFLYTTGAKLLAAHEIADLAIRNEERHILWGALRDRADMPVTEGYEETFPWEEALYAFYDWAANQSRKPTR